MQIETVAEGIEAGEQAETLRSLGCGFGQGFFFARPLDPAAWEGLLRSDGTVATTAPANALPGDEADEKPCAAVPKHRDRRAAA